MTRRYAAAIMVRHSAWEDETSGPMQVCDVRQQDHDFPEDLADGYGSAYYHDDNWPCPHARAAGLSATMMLWGRPTAMLCKAVARRQGLRELILYMILRY